MINGVCDAVTRAKKKIVLCGLIPLCERRSRRFYKVSLFFFPSLDVWLQEEEEEDTAIRKIRSNWPDGVKENFPPPFLDGVKFTEQPTVRKNISIELQKIVDEVLGRGPTCCPKKIQLCKGFLVLSKSEPVFVTQYDGEKG